jgi:alcohol dehydrogenase (cytochrome c)
MVCPNWLGVKNWLPGAVNPNTKVAFMALNESCMDLMPVYPGETAALSSGFWPRTRPIPNSDGRYGRVQAFDLQNRKVLWTERQHAPMTSGVLATAGGVVFAGGLDQSFSAYDEKTGKKLWTTRLNDVPSSAPISFMVDGKQYVAMVVGFGTLHSTGFLSLVPDIQTPARPSSAIYVFALP